jgi:hypothetical protein
MKQHFYRASLNTRGKDMQPPSTHRMRVFSDEEIYAFTVS